MTAQNNDAARAQAEQRAREALNQYNAEQQQIQGAISAARTATSGYLALLHAVRGFAFNVQQDVDMQPNKHQIAATEHFTPGSATQSAHSEFIDELATSTISFATVRRREGLNNGAEETLLSLVSEASHLQDQAAQAQYTESELETLEGSHHQSLPVLLVESDGTPHEDNTDPKRDPLPSLTIGPAVTSRSTV